MGFTIAVPLSLEWLVGMAIDNLAHILSAVMGASPSYPRYRVESKHGVNVIVIELPDQAYHYLVSLARSDIVKQMIRKWYHLVDGFVVKNISSKLIKDRPYLQDLIELCISNRGDLENSLSSISIELDPNGNKLSITWGCKEPFIPSNLIPYPLRTIEVLKGARTTCPVQLEIVESKSRRGRKEKAVTGGLVIEFQIDANVYAFMSLALTVSTIHLERWPPASLQPRTVRALIYRLTGYDAPKVLVQLFDRGMNSWRLLRDLIGTKDDIGKVFSLDQERGLEVPEVLLIHFLLSSLSRYAELYNARIDIASYKHISGRRGDIDLLLSIHFSEYRPLMMIFARNPDLGEQYREVLVKLAEKLRSKEEGIRRTKRKRGSEEEKRKEEELRAARMGLEMVYIIDKLGKGIATPFDLYALPRILESYRRSKYYAVFGESFRVFEDLVEEYLRMFG